jgi:Protein of unknown function (DUF2384)
MGGVTTVGQGTGREVVSRQPGGQARSGAATHVKTGAQTRSTGTDGAQEADGLKANQRGGANSGKRNVPQPGKRRAQRLNAKAGRPTPVWGPAERAARLARLFGTRGLARLLGVSPSQPSRWQSGQEVPGPLVAPRLVDLDYVVSRLLLLWDESVLLDWLTGPNGFLEGARPIDVILTRGTTDVVDAIQAQASGAYA